MWQTWLEFVLQRHADAASNRSLSFNAWLCFRQLHKSTGILHGHPLAEKTRSDIIGFLFRGCRARLCGIGSFSPVNEAFKDVPNDPARLWLCTPSCVDVKSPNKTGAVDTSNQRWRQQNSPVRQVFCRLGQSLCTALTIFVCKPIQDGGNGQCY